ncbi:hypothetical protein BKA93DRAFT_164681 [Sparassis latifolia]
MRITILACMPVTNPLIGESRAYGCTYECRSFVNRDCIAQAGRFYLLNDEPWRGQARVRLGLECGISHLAGSDLGPIWKEPVTRSGHARMARSRLDDRSHGWRRLACSRGADARWAGFGLDRRYLLRVPGLEREAGRGIHVGGHLDSTRSYATFWPTTRSWKSQSRVT